MREAFERSRANLSSFQSSFSVENEDEELADSTPLQTRILQIVKSSPNYTIRPARLSHELGISIADASAELCGLLAAVGEGSSFHFEDVGDDNHLQQEEDKANIVKTMVFQFPKDFEQRAHWKQRREDWKRVRFSHDIFHAVHPTFIHFLSSLTAGLKKKEFDRFCQSAAPCIESLYSIRIDHITLDCVGGGNVSVGGCHRSIVARRYTRRPSKFNPNEATT